MGRVGGIPPQQQLSSHPLLKTALDELSLASSADISKPKRKAPQVPLFFIKALGGAWCLLMSRSTFACLLGIACFVFAGPSLRRSQGLQPKSLRFREGFLRGTLTRTKTIGSGKKVEELYLHVDREAWLVHSTWLGVGLALWQETGTSPDYFLVLPTAVLQKVIHLKRSRAIARP